MADLALEVAAYLETNSVGTRGTSIFRGNLPDDTDNCIAITNTGGIPMGSEIQALHKFQTVQVMVRNSVHATGFSKAQTIHNLLIAVAHTTIATSGTYIYTIKALGEPGYLGKDENGRHMFSANYVLRSIR